MKTAMICMLSLLMGVSLYSMDGEEEKTCTEQFLVFFEQLFVRRIQKEGKEFLIGVGPGLGIGDPIVIQNNPEKHRLLKPVNIQ